MTINKTIKTNIPCSKSRNDLKYRNRTVRVKRAELDQTEQSDHVALPDILSHLFAHCWIMKSTS